MSIEELVKNAFYVHIEIGLHCPAARIYCEEGSFRLYIKWRKRTQYRMVYEDPSLDAVIAKAYKLIGKDNKKER